MENLELRKKRMDTAYFFDGINWINKIYICHRRHRENRKRVNHEDTKGHEGKTSTTEFTE